jgi:excisionase family DNA binding protein
MPDNSTRAAEARKGSPFLTTDEAALYLGLSSRSLERMRWQGGGPRFRKHGRQVRYHIDDIEEWSTAHRARSTAQFRAAGGPR